jgi:hypothetical protein
VNSQYLTGWRRYFFAIALLVFGAQSAWAEGAGEYRVKSALVLNFARFTEWPTDALGSEDTPFNVCVMGEAHLAKDFESLKGKHIGTRPVVVIEDASLEQSIACQVIFVAGTDREKLPRLFSAIYGRPILTIGEMSAFTDSGGMVNFVEVNGRLKFIVNLKHVYASKMNLSARLLKLAYAVKE